MRYPTILLLVTVLVAGLATGGCTSAGSGSAVLVRGTEGPLTAIPLLPGAPADERAEDERAEAAAADDGAGGDDRSVPYWVPVDRLEGRGDSLTDAFTVAAEAVQWRLTWECEAGPGVQIAVVPGATGVPLDRLLADVDDCPEEGRAFAQSSGPLALQVRGEGTWSAVIDQQVTVPLIQPVPQGLATAEVLSSGQLHPVDRDGRGSVSIVQTSGGRRLLRLQDFYVSPNTELELRLSPVADPRSTPEVAEQPFVSVAMLEATAGTMTFEVPENIDLEQYRSLVIWCELTFNAYAAAALA